METRADWASLRIGIVGGGHMGQALLTGWIEGQTGAASELGARNFSVVNPGAEKRAAIHERFGVSCVENVAALPDCDVLVLCVKPQIVFDVLRSMEGLDFMDSVLVLSPVAGVSTASLEAALPAGARVLRFMPNMPLAISRGVLPLCAGASAQDADCQQANRLLSCLGSVYWVEEDQMHAVTAVSGSGPGYFAAMIAAMAQAGADAGLSYDLAEALARDTAEGTAAYMRERGLGAADTRDSIATPGGTTSAGLDAMEQAGFSTAVRAGVTAAAARSAELAAQFTA